MNNESVGKKIVEALKKQAESIELDESVTPAVFDEESSDDSIFESAEETDNSFFADEKDAVKEEEEKGFFDDINSADDIFGEVQETKPESNSDNFEMPSNIAVLKKLISQLPSGVSRHTGAQIIKQTMEALGISMKSVLQDAQQVQDSLKTSARECQANIQEYKKQILQLEKQSQNYQKQYSALNDLISLFVQTTR